jgi:hypothetical protein
MSAYAATARLNRVPPRLVIGRPLGGDVEAMMVAPEPDEAVADLAPIDDRDPLIDRLAAARARWSQLTFYLFDAESWR